MSSSSLDRIRDTTMLGLNIGVLSGVSSGIMKQMNKMFDMGTKKKKSSKKRKRR